MLIDMHNHTNVSSPCSALHPEELIEAARLSGLDGLCVTDHTFIEGANTAQEVGRRLNFPVFRGVEVTSKMGDMLVFGCYEDFEGDVPLEDLCRKVHAAGGLVFAAHPFHTGGGWNLNAALKEQGLDLLTDWRRVPVLIELDGLEVINGNCRPFANEDAMELAKRMNKPGIGGSDAHRPGMIGKAATRFRAPISTDAELVAALKAWEYEAVYLR